MSDGDSQRPECRGTFENHKIRLRGLEKTIHGNGSGGISERLARIEGLLKGVTYLGGVMMFILIAISTISAWMQWRN